MPMYISACKWSRSFWWSIHAFDFSSVWVLACGIHGISCHLTRSSSLFVKIFLLLCKRRICFKMSGLHLGLCFLVESPCDGTIFWPGLEMSLISGYSQNPMGKASFSWAAATYFNVRPFCFPGTSILWDIQSSLRSESREPLLARWALFTSWNDLLARLFCWGVESLVWCRVAQYRPGDHRSPGSHLCRAASVRRPAGPTPPGWSPQPHLRRSSSPFPPTTGS